jgi:hypothetical protein
MTADGRPEPADTPEDAAEPTPAPEPGAAEPKPGTARAGSPLPPVPSWMRREKLDYREISARHPQWGPSTLSLLVLGVAVGFFTLGSSGQEAMKRCAAQPVAVCDPRTEGLILALPILATGLGLVISLIGGRMLIRRGKSPMVATAIGWAVFVIAGLVTFVAGGHA